MSTKEKTYKHLEPRPDSRYRELFVRGRRLRASVLVWMMQANRWTPHEAAQNYDLPVEAVLDAMDYVKTHQEFLEEELRREEADWEASGIRPVPPPKSCRKKS